MSRHLIICGPTASGKTAVAVGIARATPPAELINADSRQTMHTLIRATFQPSSEELEGIPCHLTGVRAPNEEWSAAHWCEEAAQRCAKLDEQHIRSIVVGGTGLYVRALANGYTFPGTAPDPTERKVLEEQWMSPQGRELLLREVDHADPHIRATIDDANPRRVIRLLERLRHGRDTAFSQPMPGRFGIYGIWVPRDILRARILHRVEWMFRSGAVAQDIADARAAGYSDAEIAGCGIGYREELLHEAGGASIEEAISLAFQRTVRYAKQQRTWFRHEPGIEWILGNRPVVEMVSEILYREQERMQPHSTAQQVRSCNTGAEKPYSRL